MIRFALLIGASTALVYFLLNTSPSQQGEVRELEFEREIAPLVTSVGKVITSAPQENNDEGLVSTNAVGSFDTDEPPALAETINEKKEKITEPSSPPPPSSKVARLDSLAPEVLNEKARAALVNILCESVPPLRSTSGSGVMIDPRGIILTNAHIAQYFLLEGTRYSVSCTVRAGSPAIAKWHAKLVFIPESWIEKHAKDILASRATSTGEHDYAFLMITDSLDGAPLPTPFPYVPLNYEEIAIVTGDPVLVAGYPAEFIGGSAARNSLHATTVFSNITQLLTFTEDVVDVISVAGTILAQSGSSGGSFVDMYGSLVGLIVTTSAGDTTGLRNLHAITPLHIDRSIRQHLGLSMSFFLSQERMILTSSFEPKVFELSKKLQDAIELQRY